jgi:hypothetical protein
MLITNRWGYFVGATTCPAPLDPDNPTTTELEEALQWDRKDAIASYLLSKRLPSNINLDIEYLPTAKEQWDIISRTFTAKSDYVKTSLHQAFMDTKCLKGGDTREFLTTLRTKRYKLQAIDIDINDLDYKHTILNGLPDALMPFASLTLTHLNISSKYTSKPVDLSKFIDLVSKEADRAKACCALKDQPGKGKTGSQTDKALAITNGNARCRKGNCHHCNKPGHWACECHTRKREEDAAKAAADQSGQGAQANPGTTTKPVNKPVGSANVAIIDKYDSDDRGFWAVKEEEVHVCHAEPDHRMDNSDSNDKDDSYNKWEAFRADTWGVEDAGDLDWAGLDIQLAKEGEKQDTREEAGAATLLEDSTPHTGSQPIPHNAPHAHAITNTLEPHWAPGEEGYIVKVGDLKVRLAQVDFGGEFLNTQGSVPLV